MPTYRRRDMAVDLGTANTVVHVRHEGIILFEPSVIAIDERTGQVHAVGDEARRMIGRTPATIRATRPLRHGVIADFDMTEQMLRRFLAKANGNRRSHRRVVLCVPSGITDVEERAVKEATLTAGARYADVIEEPMAAAIGAGLPVAEPNGNMVVDIGGGTTEVAVISLGGIVVSRSLRVGGYEMDEAIVRYVRDHHKLLIGQERAEAVKIEVGSAVPFDGLADTEVSGRDLVTGGLRRVGFTAEEAREALQRPVGQIIETVKETLEETPPELAADITNRGIVLVGGGALLRGLDQLMRVETQLPVYVADSALTCVATGAGESLEELPVIQRVGRMRRIPRRRRHWLR
ncbi:MAG TPA: rod shape-determining protein [Gaiellaceae bacterium]|nr:rod shape-determining protein [Gaiellaceae bacterium]